MVVDVIGVLAILLDPNHFREVYGGWWLARTAQTPICAVCTSHRMFETGIEIGAVRASKVISVYSRANHWTHVHGNIVTMGKHDAASKKVGESIAIKIQYVVVLSNITSIPLRHQRLHHVHSTKMVGSDL